MTSNRIQQAVYEYITDPRLSILSVALANDLNPSTLHSIIIRWKLCNPDVVPPSPSAVNLPERGPGRPRAFSADEEDLIASNRWT